jgi:alditol oxidase
MTPQHNWAKNHVFEAVRIHHPVTVSELQNIVAKTTKLRAIGARHSFNAVADSPGDLVDLSNLGPNVEIDRERQTVTVGAGVTYAVLARTVERQGFALHNLASLPQISVAGAIATGTHGSGDKSGSLATAV